MNAFFLGKDNDMNNQITLLQSQYSRVLEEKRLNIIEDDKVRTTLNRITIGLIDLTENINS